MKVNRKPTVAIATQPRPVMLWTVERVRGRGVNPTASTNHHAMKVLLLAGYPQSWCRERVGRFVGAVGAG